MWGGDGLSGRAKVVLSGGDDIAGLRSTGHADGDVPGTVPGRCDAPVGAVGGCKPARPAARLNAASLNLAASCQPVPVTFSSRTSWCPLNVAELL